MGLSQIAWCGNMRLFKGDSHDYHILQRTPFSRKPDPSTCSLVSRYSLSAGDIEELMGGWASIRLTRPMLGLKNFHAAQET